MLSALLQRPAAFGLRAAERLSFLAPLATRLVLGLAFYRTGLGKLRNHERTAEFFAGLGLPAADLQAWFIGGLELAGGMCLLLGLLTRPMAFLLSGTMVVALLTADRAAFLQSWNGGGPTSVTAFTFLLFLAWLLLFGPGKLSLDAWLRRRLVHPQGRASA